MSRVKIIERCRLAPLDWALAAFLGTAACVVYACLSIPLPDPAQWEEVAVAARLVPPREVFPGLWRALAAWTFAGLDVAPALKVLSFAGAALGGAAVALVYLVVRQLLALQLRTATVYTVWSRRLAPFFAAVAALLVAVSDPFWRIVQTFSPDELRFLMLLGALHLWLAWLTRGGLVRLYSLVALVGVLAAETPLAFLLAALFVFGYFRFWRFVYSHDFAAAEDLPEPKELPRWRMFFLFLGALGLGVWLNAAIFTALGGVTANGWSGTDIYFHYGFCYGKVVRAASSGFGWLLGFAFCVCPLVIALRLAPAAAADDRPMVFHTGVILVFAAVLAIFQTGAFPAATFWFRSAAAVTSGFLLAVYLLCVAVAVAMIGAAFAFECQCTYRAEGTARPGVLLRGLVPALAVALVLLTALRLSRGVEREMKSIVRDTLAETLRECAGAKWIFTDGHLDNGLRLMAAAEGSDLRPLNMMSGGSRRERTLREAAFPAGSVDRDNAGVGVPLLLRVWKDEKPGGLDEAAVQLGFELWKREQQPLPPVSGLVARTKGFPADEPARGIAAAEALAARILAVSPRLAEARASSALSDAFSAVTWRLSRLARLRSDTALADRLDEANTALKHLLTLIQYEHQRTFMGLTPWEGLQIALRRADFAEAMRYAPAVLRSDADSPEANFGMGMGCLQNGRMDDAERYLRRCLVRRPDEPVVLNNLSIICRKGRRWEEAESLARRALELLPDSPEVQQTLKDAQERAP